MKPSVTNCWEFKKCGREPGGEKASESGVCPAAAATRLDGTNGGVAGGRVCWAVAGTMCGFQPGEVHGVDARKILNCLNCAFLRGIRGSLGAAVADAVMVSKLMK